MDDAKLSAPIFELSQAIRENSMLLRRREMIDRLQLATRKYTLAEAAAYLDCEADQARAALVEAGRIPKGAAGRMSLSLDDLTAAYEWLCEQNGWEPPARRRGRG